MKEAGPHFSLAGEVLGSVWGVPITNTLITTWMVMGFLTLIALFISRQRRLIPSYFQGGVEVFIGGLYSLFEAVLGKKTARFFPLLATLFLFILFNNWVEVLPGVGSIGEPPFFRAATADLNTTLALALLAVFALQYYGIKSLGSLGYLGRFINFKSPLSFFVGLLELVSEVAKIVSFAFRLFGNIFAGEVLLTVVAFLIPLFAPLPFLGLELFVGFIQALVFSMLTAVFLAIAISKAEH